MESPREIAKWSGIICVGAFVFAALSFFPAEIFYSTVGSPTEVHPLVLLVSGFLLWGSVGVGVVSFVLYVVARMWEEARSDARPVEGSAPAVPTAPPVQPACKGTVWKLALAILLWMIASGLLLALVVAFYMGFSTHLPPGL